MGNNATMIDLHVPSITRTQLGGTLEARRPPLMEMFVRKILTTPIVNAVGR